MRQGIARTFVLTAARNIRVGELTVEEDNRRHLLGPGGPPYATIVVRSPAAWPLLARGLHGCIDAFRDGLIDSPDLTSLVRLAARNLTALDPMRRRVAGLRAVWSAARSGFARNTPEQSRRDIAAHYDLGNDLFALMLDPTMMYSCAVFDGRESSLHEASLRKLEMVCEKLDLGSGDRVVEIGTGWGGFAIYAAMTRGCRVTTTTISQAQYRFACERVRDAGLQHLIDVRFDDYRELRGRYDKLVSLEMIEAVGHKDFGTYFACCSKLLEPDGTMLLQAITVDDRNYDAEKGVSGFITAYIFPNGCLPSQRVIADCLARHTKLRTVHMEDFTPHYTETLRRWRANFDAAEAQLDRLGYDVHFRRLWRLYLSYCEAGFEEGRIGVVQMVMADPRHTAGRIRGIQRGVDDRSALA